MSSRPPLNAWQAEPKQKLTCQLLEQADFPERDWPALDRAQLLGSIREDLAHAHGRSQMIVAAFACCAAFLAGLWAASHTATLRREVTAEPSAASEGILRGSIPADADALQGATAPRWEALDLGGIGLLEVAGTGAYEVREFPQERQLRIESGTLRAQIARQDSMRPLVIVARGLRIIVVGTRFDVFVEGAVTRVEVMEGHVRVESSARSVELSGGEGIRSDDPRLKAIGAPAAAAPATSTQPDETSEAQTVLRTSTRAPGKLVVQETLEDCEHVALPTKRAACLGRVADGTSLAAEEALLTLGLLTRDRERDPDRAVATLLRHRQRFPRGALGPEVTLALFETLLQQGRTEEALSAAVDFEERFPADSRAPRVALARARILCGIAGDRALGRTVLDRWSGRVDPELRAEFAATRARCEGPSFGPAGPAGLVPRDVLGGAPPGD